MKRINIAGRFVGQGKPCFVIAEAGINHNGDINLAKKLIDIASNAGVDAVKFQTFKAEDVVTEKVQMASYQKNNLGAEKSQLEMLRQYELDYADFKILQEYCDEKSIIFLSTPHSEGAAEFLEPLVPAFKIGSGDLTNIPFLEKVAEKGKPMIVGTGMSTLKEVKDALKAIHIKKNKQVVMLHCTTDYPCPLDEVNLLAMKTMQKELDCLVGYSDHTLGFTVPIMAATLGAFVIEKHFTLDRNMSGPDHKASLEPDELKYMVLSIREVEEALGEAEKHPTKGERKIMSSVRKSILARRDLSKGAIIERDMLAVKRPGDGLDPRLIEKIVGKRLKKRVKRDTKIDLSDLE